MLNLDFVKAQGIGNDFIIIEDIEKKLTAIDLGNLALRMCDRHFGVGADGLMIVESSEIADYRMRIINADGSEAEMCGNGIRCFARYLYDRKMVGDSMKIETLAGIKVIDVKAQGDDVAFQVNMGAPEFSAEKVPVIGEGEVIAQPIEINGTQYEVTCLSTGVPHCIIFVVDVDAVDLEWAGPRIETHPMFPKKTNVEFAQMISREEIKVRVWERGAGTTLACGTGACATLAAAVLNDLAERKAIIHLPGGDLLIEWAEDDDIYMTGPAEEVFTGKFAV